MKLRPIWLLWVLLLFPLPAFAQNNPQTVSTTAAALPPFYQLQNVRYEPQQWNNCGPATLTNALSFFGYQNNQTRAADWLKPHYEDKNVSPNQLAEFVNTQVTELPVHAKVRYGGTRERLQQLIANDFPVIIEKGYDPEPHDLGWMGHYLLVIGYDESRTLYITHDSYISANYEYDYAYIEKFWQHFNYTYIVLYTSDREDELNAILGEDANERANYIHAYELARSEAIANQEDPFAWFNMGTNFVYMGMYTEAALAYDQARSLGLPWRMFWYQFGPFEAYYQVGRYNDMLTMAQQNLNDGGGQFVEETFYYGGLARQGLGEYDRALSNFDQAIAFNPNFTLAREAREALLVLMQQQDNNGG